MPDGQRLYPYTELLVIQDLLRLSLWLRQTCYRLFPGYGHFCGKRDMADDTFPELFETILRNRMTIEEEVG